MRDDASFHGSHVVERKYRETSDTKNTELVKIDYPYQVGTFEDNRKEKSRRLENPDDKYEKIVYLPVYYSTAAEQKQDISLDKNSKEISQLQENINLLTKEISEQEDKTCDYLVQINELRSSLESNQEKNDLFIRSNDKLQKYEQDISKVTKDIQLKKNKIRKLIQIIKTLLNKKNTLEESSNVVQYEQAIQELTQLFAKNTSTAQDKIHSLQKDITQDKTRYLKKVIDFKQKILQLESQNKQLKGTYDELLDKYDMLLKKREEADSDSSDTERSKLILKVKKTTCKRHKRSFKEVNDAIKDLRHEQEIVFFKKQNELLREQIERYEDAIMLQAKEYNTKIISMDTQHEQEVTNTQNEIQELIIKHEALKAIIAERMKKENETITSLERELQKLIADKAAIEQDVQEFTLQIQELSKQNEEHKETITNLHKNVHKLTERIEENNVKLKEYEHIISKMKLSTIEKEKQQNSFASILVNIKKRQESNIEKLTYENRQLTERAELQKTELDKFTEESTKQSGTIHKLTEDVKTFTTKFDRELINNERLAKLKDTLLAQINDLTATNNTLSSTNVALTKQISKLQEVNNALSNEKQQLLDQLVAANKENEANKTEKEEYTKSIEIRDQKNDQQLEEIQGLNDLLDEYRRRVANLEISLTALDNTLVTTVSRKRRGFYLQDLDENTLSPPSKLQRLA